MTAPSFCKFCGRKVTHGHSSCPECTLYCRTKCPISSSPSTSWHKEPCTSCKHNPYNKKPGPAV